MDERVGRNEILQQEANGEEDEQEIDEFQDVKGLIDLFTRIKRQLLKCKQWNKDFLSSKERVSEKSSTKKLESYFNVIKNEIGRLKDMCKKIEREISQREVKDAQFQDSVQRMKGTLIKVVKSQIVILIKDLFLVQKDFKQTSNGKLKTKLKVYRSDLKEEQVERLIQNPEEVQRIIQKVLYGQEQIEMNNAIDDIKEQLNDIKRVENSVFTLVNMLENFYETLQG